MMKNRHLGILLVIAGVIAIFVENESWAWVISALLVGGGTGIFFWKDKVGKEEDE